MAARTKRIELRADPASEQQITRAAKSQALSVSAFVLGAATREADRVLGRADQTLMPPDLFDALVGALDEADGAPRVKSAGRQARRYRRA